MDVAGKPKLWNAGGNDFQVARNQPGINSGPDERLVEALRYAMLLVGIKERNFPDAVERVVLFNFIRKKYSGHTAEEIRLAFEKAIARELELDENDIKHFENFSCEYFARIMNAYRKWARKEHAKIEAQFKADQLLLTNNQPVNWRYEVEKVYGHFRDGKLNVRLLPREIYLQIESDELLPAKYYERFLKAVNQKLTIENELARAKITNSDMVVVLYAMQLATESYFKRMDSLQRTAIYSLENESD